ncbi:MAG: dienelactone hydrolase family protein [Dehalococcoidia bacterium]|nr:dienelactone hydrolase family protein [Dehalococcoidia bacterium]
MTTRRIPDYEGMLAETVLFAGDKEATIGGYIARPLGGGLHPGVIVIHEVFGLVEHTKEIARKFAAHGYIALAPDLYYREGPGELEKIVAGVRQQGGVPDARLIGDLEGAVNALRSVADCNGKIGCIGYCSGGRQTLLFACNTKNLSAAVDCYGGRVITDELNPNQPRAVIDMIASLSCPLLGLFGEMDQNPSPQHVSRLEEELKKYGKTYEFKRFEGDVGHGFFADYRPSYRQAAAVEGWQRIFDFYGRYLW